MRPANSQTARIKRRYDDIAPRYDSMISSTERFLLSGGRAWIGAQARGDVLEIAVGTGRNLPYYRVDSTITGIDLSPEMIEIALEQSRSLGVAADLAVGDAEELQFEDASFDTVVSTLSLCTIPDLERAINEVWRVLRPGGCFVSIEHVRSPNLLVRLVQRALNPLSVRFACDNLLREPLGVLERAGFEMKHFERSKLGIIEHVVACKSA